MENLSAIFFIICGLVLSVVDFKKQIIPDVIILPSIVILAILKYNETLNYSNFILATLVVIVTFSVLLYFFQDFGGGDIRFGILCSIFLGFPNIFIFFILAGAIHLILLIAFSKRVMGFAPTMFLAAIITKKIATEVWRVL